MMLRTLAAGAALAMLATAASAQPIYERRVVEYAPGYAPYAQSSPAYGYGYGRGGGMCQAWCSEDASPCDPPNFKIADGRCRPKMFR